jgi:hypothetical protein
MTQEQVAIELNGAEYFLAPTYEAAMAIEEELAPLPYLWKLLQEMKLDLRATSKIISIGIAAKSGSISNRNDERCQKWVYSAGAGSDDVREAVSEFLLAMLFTPDQLKKKREAEELENQDTLGAIKEALMAMPSKN